MATICTTGSSHTGLWRESYLVQMEDCLNEQWELWVTLLLCSHGITPTHQVSQWCFLKNQRGGEEIEWETQLSFPQNICCVTKCNFHNVFRRLIKDSFRIVHPSYVPDKPNNRSDLKNGNLISLRKCRIAHTEYVFVKLLSLKNYNVVPQDLYSRCPLCQTYSRMNHTYTPWNKDCLQSFFYFRLDIKQVAINYSKATGTYLMAGSWGSNKREMCSSGGGRLEKLKC